MLHFKTLPRLQAKANHFHEFFRAIKQSKLDLVIAPHDSVCARVRAPALLPAD